MILHTVIKSPFNHHALRDCLQLMDPTDALLLLEDGVYACCTPHTDVVDQLKRLSEAGASVFAIGDDLAARGLSGGVADFVEVIDYAGFVELTTRSTATHSWY